MRLLGFFPEGQFFFMAACSFTEVVFPPYQFKIYLASTTTCAVTLVIPPVEPPVLLRPKD